MESPKEIHEDLREDLQLKESEVAVVHGQILGSVFVKGKSTFILHGIVRGNVWIEENGSAFIHGIVTGNVTNNGGIVKHYGLIKGQLNSLSGETIIHPKAVVCQETC